MKSPEIVLFDAVGTVIEPNPQAADIYYSLGHQHGSNLTREIIQDNFRASFKRVFGQSPTQRTSNAIEYRQWADVVSRVFTDLKNTDEIFLTLWDHFANPENWRIYDDVPECWEELSRRGVNIGLASNFDDRLKNICKTNQFDSLDHIFYSGDVGFRKPDERFYKAIEKRIGFHSSQIFMVGDDMINDVLAPGRCGWSSFLIDRSGNSSDPLGIHSLNDLSVRIF